MHIINGQTVPPELSISELEQMMISSDMQTFRVACETLRLSNDPLLKLAGVSFVWYSFRHKKHPIS